MLYRVSTDVWTSAVQDSGHLFYSEPAEGVISYPRQDESAYHSRQASYQSTGSHHSSNSDSPRLQFHRHGSRTSNVVNQHSPYNGSQELRQGSANSEYSFKRDITLRQSDQSYTGFSMNLNRNVEQQGPPKTSQRIPSKHSGSHAINGSSAAVYSQSGKRKSVIFVPNRLNVSDLQQCQGVELCEKLYGIKLCHHKQKPPRPNGASVDQALRDRKIIVQGVVEHSAADICGQINRGQYEAYYM